MVEDGMMDRFGVQEVYGMHNMPGLPVGHFATRTGPLMAAADRFTIEIEGQGGHAAHPHHAIDTVVIASQLVQALQTIVARNVDPLESAVVSTTFMRAGDAFNVLPQTAELRGTVRTFKPAVQDMIERRMGEIAHGVATMHGATARLVYVRGYPPTLNHAEQTAFAAKVAASISGADAVNTEAAPVMGAEDFSFMLEARPGAFVFVGNGSTAGLHHPAYDFDDSLIPVGVSYWARLVETAMPAA
jgi:hippurate hydrolase